MRLPVFVAALFAAVLFWDSVLPAEGSVIFTSQHREVDEWSVGTPTAYGIGQGAQPQNSHSANIAPDFSSYGLGAWANSVGNVYSSLMTTANGGGTVALSFDVAYYQTSTNDYSWVYYTAMETQISFTLDQAETLSFTHSQYDGTYTFTGQWNMFLGEIDSVTPATIVRTLPLGNYTLDYVENDQSPGTIHAAQMSATFAMTPAPTPEPSTPLLALFGAILFLRRRRSGAEKPSSERTCRVK